MAGEFNRFFLVQSRQADQQRSGTVLVLIAVLMSALALTVALSIDIAYIHVSKMELSGSN